MHRNRTTFRIAYWKFSWINWFRIFWICFEFASSWIIIRFVSEKRTSLHWKNRRKRITRTSRHTDRSLYWTLSTKSWNRSSRSVLTTWRRRTICSQSIKWANEEIAAAKRLWNYSWNRFTQFETWAKIRWLRFWAWMLSRFTIMSWEQDYCTIDWP